LLEIPSIVSLSWPWRGREGRKEKGVGCLEKFASNESDRVGLDRRAAKLKVKSSIQLSIGWSSL